MNISDFYKYDYCNYASYDNYRKIASAVDGLKVSGRKCLYTAITDNVKTPYKVASLKSDAASKTQYMHGDDSLIGVIVNLATSYDNNVPLLKSLGNFGSRLIPEAAAARYIFTCQQDYLGKLFRKEDEFVMNEQIFEGKKIEYQSYLPILPLLLLNGSTGLTTGFSQKILPRNPKDVIKYIKNILQNKKQNVELVPWLNVFTGNVKKGDGDNSWVIEGKVDVIKNNKLLITEIPFDYDLKGYISVLDRLEDNGQIRGYKDLSEDGKFKFEVDLFANRGISSSDSNLLDKLKLKSSITENFTSLNYDNKVVEFDNIDELLKYYYDIRINKYTERKKAMIDFLTGKLNELKSRWEFINAVAQKKIVLYEKTDDEVIAQIDKFNGKNVKIIKIEDSYDYLLNMNVRSLTKAQLEKLSTQINGVEAEIKKISGMTSEELWLQDIEDFEKNFDFTYGR